MIGSRTRVSNVPSSRTATVLSRRGAATAIRTREEDLRKVLCIRCSLHGVNGQTRTDSESFVDSSACPLHYADMALLTGVEPATFSVTGRCAKPLHFRSMATLPGLEPRITDRQSVVLPLHHRALARGEGYDPSLTGSEPVVLPITPPANESGEGVCAYPSLTLFTIGNRTPTPYLSVRQTDRT